MVIVFKQFCNLHFMQITCIFLIVKNTTRYGIFAYTVDTVYPVDMIYTVDMVFKVHTVDTVYTIQTALRCLNEYSR